MPKHVFHRSKSPAAPSKPNPAGPMQKRKAGSPGKSGISPKDRSPPVVPPKKSVNLVFQPAFIADGKDRANNTISATMQKVPVSRGPGGIPLNENPS